MSAGDALGERTSDAVRKILDLENDGPDVLFDALPGATVPFWAQVRVQVGWALSAQQNGSVDVETTSSWSRWGELKRVARGYLPSRWDAVRRARPHPVCFYVSGVTLAAEGDRARNWLVDDYAEASEDAVVVQARPLPAALGRPVFEPTLSLEAATARARWRARGKPLPAGTESRIREILAECARRLGVPSDSFAAIGRSRLRPEVLRPHLQDEVKRMFERIRPELVFYDNGSYTYNGETIGLLKDLGVRVVEPQHGWIGPSHVAYNFGDAWSEPRLARALPDELLTFGSYWSDSIRYPGEVTALGKPHLERQAALAPSTRPKQILVVSSRADPEGTDAFVVDLRAAVGKEWRVVFRPHPGELAETERRYPRLSGEPGVTVDRVNDVYETLKSSAVVIGVASTVLFEARAFGCHVIARDSAFAENVIGAAFGDRVTSVTETVARLRGLETGNGVDASTDPQIWAPNAVSNYQRWLHTRLSRRE
ncbi:hypothetical protein ACWGJP_14150 [Microbacterium sp. NPDC055903]